MRYLVVALVSGVLASVGFLVSVALATTAPGAASRRAPAARRPAAKLRTTHAPIARRATTQQDLSGALQSGIDQLGSYSGAYVVDLTTGQALFGSQDATRRLPASVEKLYTTAAALTKFGPQATLTTSLLATGAENARGVWTGMLYLRGGGDPTFGDAGFVYPNYGAGATIGRLVVNLVDNTAMTAFRGRILGDETYFDSARSTIESGFQFDPYMEGSLSALAFDRGIFNEGNSYISDPPLYAAGQLAAALRATHVSLPGHQPIGSGRTPRSAQLLATVHSPRMAKLIALTNAPSDNFFAEMLTKDLGARFGGAGTTAAGVAVIRRVLARKWRIHPRFDDGSGLSRNDATTPGQVVALLKAMRHNSAFTNSLAIAGETGTLQYEMQGTVAQGRCSGKTGTLHDVASLVGYCHAVDGHTLAFAFLANGLGDPAAGHDIEANMATAVAAYGG